MIPPACTPGEVSMRIELNDEEIALVFRVIRNRMIGLRDEVRHNKDSEVRRYLKHKEKILSRVLDRFPEHDEQAHMKGFIV